MPGVRILVTSSRLPFALDMIPILGGGTVFFIVLVPAALFRKRP